MFSATYDGDSDDDALVYTYKARVADKYKVDARGKAAPAHESSADSYFQHLTYFA